MMARPLPDPLPLGERETRTRWRAPAVLVVVFLLLDQLFTVLAGHEGLLAPFGPVRLAPALLGLFVITLRLAVTFLVLPWAAWRLTR